MFKYPDDFDSPAFPAGKPVAVSRFMAIAVVVVVFLLLCVCGLVVWGSKSLGIHPFLVSVNPVTGSWELVGHDHGQKVISRSRALQESILYRIFTNVFTISDNVDFNLEIWQKCDRDQCAVQSSMDTECAIYCNVSDDLFNSLTSSMATQNRMRFESGERLSIMDINIIPNHDVTDQGGLWTIHSRIKSNITGIFNVIAYARISSNTQSYPQTMGFFVDTFNAYKINK